MSNSDEKTPGSPASDSSSPQGGQAANPGDPDPSIRIDTKIRSDAKLSGNGDETPSSFIFVICQAGAEAAARKEILSMKNVPFGPLKLAFSRPGFLTFKVDPESPPPARFTLPSTLARTYGWSLGKVKGTDAGELVKQVCKDNMIQACETIHVYQRETMVPGANGFEPGVSALAAEVAGLFEKDKRVSKGDIRINRIAPPDSMTGDVVMVTPDEWWFGVHYSVTRAGRWPGGVPLFATDEEKTSRAYFKLKEALLWSGISIAPGDVCAEIGSAPGGACELLLELGAKVIAVDPAELEPEIEQHAELTWIRRRGHEVRKREFSNVRWLMADLNIAPKYTLDTVRDIVNHESVNVAGLLLTLKVNDWNLIDEVPDYIRMVKGWGFQVVRTRQLAFNRREFCLMAARDKFVLRDSRRKSRLRRGELQQENPVSTAVDSSAVELTTRGASQESPAAGEGNAATTESRSENAARAESHSEIAAKVSRKNNDENEGKPRE